MTDESNTPSTCTSNHCTLPRPHAIHDLGRWPSDIRVENEELEQRYLAAEAKLAKAREALETADGLLNDYYAAHRSRDSSDYNQCEKPGDECLWCVEVDAFRTALAAIRAVKP